MENLLRQIDQGAAFAWDGRFEAVPARSKSLGRAETKLPVRKKRPLCSALQSLCCPMATAPPIPTSASRQLRALSCTGRRLRVHSAAGSVSTTEVT